MLGAVQLGVMAACVVLFVPMGMAGWHLSRNKMLFFSGALFITLAVGVHLTPYFPSISDLASSVSSFVVFDSRVSCLSLLHDVVWRSRDRSWDWSPSRPVSACGFQKLAPPDTSDLLNGSWVVVAGDSQARLLALSLLQLVLGSKRTDSVKADLFKRHSDYQIMAGEIGMKLDFVWAPYVTNLTDLVVGFKRNRNYPDVLVMGSGLWHMLHFTNASDYGVGLERLRSSVVSLLPIPPELGVDGPVAGSASVRSPHLFWIGIPTLINSMLNTEEKRARMTDAMRVAYDEALRSSKLLMRSGGPLLLLDIQSLSWNCGVRCTEDGMHYDGAVYEAALHIMLNALLIQSHQRL
ncbi:protein ALTERED XYLOGLUCAN 9 [Alnus glutinosa]|uniref:protein ALTERED XYLOGLUCAN 9 n=1 Tax=Alnus glutinosa TaxID=3517 RepID=UPI002D79999E|nr:protein ALTERED XYLOGLUCAN 9 [Alnus glutinosa]